MNVKLESASKQATVAWRWEKDEEVQISTEYKKFQILVILYFA